MAKKKVKKVRKARSKMLDLHVVEQIAAQSVEKRGMLNVYICTDPTCNYKTLYSYLDSGITPMILQCAACHKPAQSLLSQCDQPILLWYRPKTKEEIKELAQNAYNLCKMDAEKEGTSLDVTIRQIEDDYIRHWNGGGLFAKPADFKSKPQAHVLVRRNTN